MRWFIEHDLWPADIIVIVAIGLAEAAFVLTLLEAAGIINLL